MRQSWISGISASLLVNLKRSTTSEKSGLLYNMISKKFSMNLDSPVISDKQPSGLRMVRPIGVS
ncbi:MAG: transglutaminase, partial [Microcoleus sp. CAN_BIN18]|nr:transglutaminase [Microcoleus sp. CAN_BIN18]